MINLIILFLLTLDIYSLMSFPDVPKTVVFQLVPTTSCQSRLCDDKAHCQHYIAFVIIVGPILFSHKNPHMNHILCQT